MKKSDLLKLALVGLSSAAVVATPVVAQNGGHSCRSNTAPSTNQGYESQGSDGSAPSTKSDGSANYTSKYSSSETDNKTGDNQNGNTIQQQQQSNGNNGSSCHGASGSCGGQSGNSANMRAKRSGSRR